MGDCWIGGLRASRMIDVPYRTLDFWVRSGLLDVEQPKPKAHRRFRFLDLLRAQTVKRLREEGVSLQTVREVIAKLTTRYQVHDPLAQACRLLVAGKRIWWAETDHEVVDILKDQLGMKPLVILEMGEMATEVKRRFDEACAA